MARRTSFRHVSRLPALLPFALSLLAGAATVARAEDPQSPVDAETAPNVELAGTTFPVGGVVVGTLGPGIGTADLEFTNVLGEPVSGAWVDVSEVRGPEAFAWRADEDVPSGTYWIEAPGYARTEFELVEGAGAVPSMSSKVSEMVVGVGPPTRCEEYAPHSSTSTIFEQYRVDAVLDVWLEGSLTSHYDFWIRLEGAGLEKVEADYHRIELEESEEQQCFEVFAQHFLDVEPQSLETACVSTARMELGLVDEAYGDPGAMLGSCTEPPVGYEAGWCEHFEAAISSGSCAGYNDSACVAAWTACSDSAPPKEAVTAAQEAGAPVSGEASQGSEKAAGESNSDQEQYPACASHTPGRSTPAPIWPLILLVPWALRRKAMRRARIASAPN